MKEPDLLHMHQTCENKTCENETPCVAASEQQSVAAAGKGPVPWHMRQTLAASLNHQASRECPDRLFVCASDGLVS